MEFNPNKTHAHDERQIKNGKKNSKQVERSLIKMIKDSCGKSDDYSILPKIRQILLHWGHELTEKDFFYSDDFRQINRRKKNVSRFQR